jgi:phosphoglycolate phosphatase-like HAD superfamily hydrolase
VPELRRGDRGVLGLVVPAAHRYRVVRKGQRPEGGRLLRVCLATGFSPVTRDAIIDELAWGGLIDLALSPADAGRGRPWPDLPLTALLRLRGGAVGELAVAGDTASDIESGQRAGAAIVAGVLTGASTRADLEQAGAPLILDTIAGILPYIVS